MQSKPLSPEEKTVEYFRTVQAGDIALFDIITEAIAVFGFTKVGKTTTCHMLTNRSPLRAQNSMGELIYKATQQRYGNALIGSTNQSQTQIPNKFDAKLRLSNGVEVSVAILDQPGYGDSYGFHRILSNGYFHYRTFSKTPKLKFILTVNKTDLQGTAQYFKKTINLFISAFSDYESIKDTILKATTLLVTKTDPAPKATTVEDLHQMLMALRDGAVATMGKTKREQFQEFIDHMIENKKVFQIHKPERAGVMTRESDILRQVYQSTEFWERPQKGSELNRVVEMSDINFSVSREILGKISDLSDDELFKQEFDYFAAYMQKRMGLILLEHKFSFKGIIEMLKCDAMDRADANSFLGGMAQFVREKDNFLPQYASKRQETIKNLFKGEEDIASESELSEQGERLQPSRVRMQREEAVVLYFLQKFKVLDFIVGESRKVMDIFEMSTNRSVEELEDISALLMGIFRKFNLLRRNSQDTTLISKYSYIITRLLEQSKIISLILFTNEKVRQKFDEYRQGMVDIYRLLQDKLFSQELSEIQTAEMKRQFVLTCDPANFDIVNNDLINFYEDAMKLSEDLKLPVSSLILRYASEIQSRPNAKNQQRRFVARKLAHFRTLFYEYLSSLEQGHKDKHGMTQRIFLLSNALGRILASLYEWDLSRTVFKSVRNAAMVLRMYKAQLQISESFGIWLEYGQYAQLVQRRELGMECYQQALSIATDYNQMNLVADRISHLGLERPQEEDESSYVSKMYHKEFCEDFDEEFKMNLEVALADEE